MPLKCHPFAENNQFIDNSCYCTVRIKYKASFLEIIAKGKYLKSSFFEVKAKSIIQALESSQMYQINNEINNLSAIDVHVL